MKSQRRGIFEEKEIRLLYIIELKTEGFIVLKNKVLIL